MTRFYFAVAVVGLMAVYQALLTAVSSHIVGYELPPLAVFVIVSVSPMLLMIANALPSLYTLLPDAIGEVPPPPTIAATVLAPLSAKVDGEPTAAPPETGGSSS